MHYEFFFQDLSNTSSFIDIDEFLFSPKDNNLVEYLESSLKQNITGFRLMQRGFGTRYCYNNSRVTDIYESYRIDSYRFAPKLIIKNHALKTGRTMHDL